MRELTPLQMKIEVEQQLQRLGSNKRDPLSEQQIEWRLNTAQDRLVSYKMIPDANVPNKFEINQKEAADIQKLIIPNYKLPNVFVEPNELYCVYSPFPSDLAYFVNDRSKVLSDCETGFESPTEDYVDKVIVYSFPDSVATSNFYQSITITVGDSVTTITTPGFTSKKEKFALIDPILNKWNGLGYNVYWEEYNGIYKPGCFVVACTNTTPVPVLKVDGITAGTETISTTRQVVKKFSARPSYPNRMYRQDFIHTIRTGNKYDQPIPNSPVSAIANNKLFVYHTKRFIVNEILIDYVRKPRRISIPLNISCELPGTTHEAICSLAVELILGNIEAQSYPTKVQENVQRLE